MPINLRNLPRIAAYSLAVALFLFGSISSKAAQEVDTDGQQSAIVKAAKASLGANVTGDALTRLTLPTMPGEPKSAATAPARLQISGGKLPTRWDKDVSPTSPLPEYPRPQMTRTRWQSLNGPWDCAFTDSKAMTPPEAFDGKILVPYPMESALSGLHKDTSPDQRLWYRRTFTIPAAWKNRNVLLHFGAVNWDSLVIVNGKPMGEHKGGYTAFDYDITKALKPSENELVVGVWNPVTADVPDAQVVGKQRVHPVSVLYTAATGIWQSVWIEPVSAAHIENLKITPDIDAGVLHLIVNSGGVAASVNVAVMDGAKTIATVRGATGVELTLPVPSPHPWSPDDPHLYDLKVSLVQGGKTVDSVGSYFAMRKVSLGKDAQGRTRILLNNRFVFQIGALDQGYWPDGIYTAPTDAALRYDIETAKGFGFNLLRKHAKVEPDRWYYWTDKLGMLVWQDMPQAFGAVSNTGQSSILSDTAKAQWLLEWEREIAEFYNHPSIILWATFNEDWGVHDIEQIAALTKQLDPTRLVDANTGGAEKGCGDLRDIHVYPGPGSDMSEANRASANGEFGGITMSVPGHLWTNSVFGYGRTLQSGWQVTKRYQELLKRAYSLRDEKGTSAFVYTQITDVEQEINGLLTYDRAIVKPDAAIITAANHGQFPPLPPNPNHELVPASSETPQKWSYVTTKPGNDWMKSGFDASAWKTGLAPFGHGIDGVNTPWTDTPGDIWLRREVTLPDVIPAKLEILTVHDEDVEVYINGVLAASAPGFVSDYVSLPMSDAARATLKPGKNLMAVHCRQTIGGQIIDVGIAAANLHASIK